MREFRQRHPDLFSTLNSLAGDSTLKIKVSQYTGHRTQRLKRYCVSWA